MDNALVFSTHIWNDDVIKYLRYLKHETIGIMDILVLYDSKNMSIDESMYPEYVFSSFNSSKEHSFFYKNDSRLPNLIIPLKNVCETFMYKHYLVMEFDIVLKGNFNKFIAKITKDDTVDYIHIAKDDEGSPYSHWPVMFIENSPYNKLYFSWCHMFYVSDRLLKECCEISFTNDYAYYEFLLPSIAYNKKYNVKQFENFGYDFRVSWGPKEKFEPLFQLENCCNTFYHPIKNLGMIDFERLKYFDLD